MRTYQLETSGRSGGLSDVKVRKAVIPAAGLGTRFLPASKAQPKEMVPVVDKPAIQYVVEEVVRAALEDHFDRSWELEGLLTDKGDAERLDQVRAISDMAEIHYIRQKMPLGLGHAISVAEQHVGDEPFAVLLGDDLIGEQENLLGDMADAFNRHQTSVIAAMEVPLPKIKLYGAVAPGEEVEPGLFRLTDIVEKPDPERAPSNLAVIGRYVLHPEIFTALRATEPDAKGEIQLSDALKRVVDTDGAQGVLAQRFTGKRYDVGEKSGYLRATVELAAAREDLGPDFVDFLREFLTSLDGAEGGS